MVSSTNTSRWNPGNSVAWTISSRSSTVRRWRCRWLRVKNRTRHRVSQERTGSFCRAGSPPWGERRQPVSVRGGKSTGPRRRRRGPCRHVRGEQEESLVAILLDRDAHAQPQRRGVPYLFPGWVERSNFSESRRLFSYDLHDTVRLFKSLEFLSFIQQGRIFTFVCGCFFDL